jgi:hypothetical protein
VLKLKQGNNIIFGISSENINRLKKDMPIKINMEELGGDGYIFIVYKDTEQELVDLASQLTGTNMVN